MSRSDDWNTEVILVNENDIPLGRMNKLEVHHKGLLHRAFSIFIFNEKGELLLQRRADTKYHSGGLWTNTCCSHPAVGESTDEACQRRLKEEMGFSAPLQFLTSFVYRAELERGLTEHEFDHVYVGRYDGFPEPDELEVSDWKYMNLSDLEEDMQQYPERYTAWLKIIFPEIKRYALDR